MKKFKVRIKLLDEMLGTKPADPEVFATYIASKRPEGPAADEIKSAESAEIQGTTGFHKLNGIPFISDYQIRGFFKEAATALKLDKNSFSYDLASPKSKIDLAVFVEPRMIPLTLPSKGALGVCERPLRAETMQGPRVALVRSESVPTDTCLEFTIKCLTPDLTNKTKEKVRIEDLILEWLDYGYDHGLGQWRNAGKGRFEYQIWDITEEEPKSKPTRTIAREDFTLRQPKSKA